MKTEISTYEQQAIDFLQATGTTFEAKFLRNGKHFEDDKESRDIYEITLRRGNRIYTFNFGQSIVDSGFYYTKGKQIFPLDRKFLEKDYFKGKSLGLVGKIKMKDWDFSNNGKSDIIHYPVEPTAYSVLACLQKYEVGTFEEFCSDFGYDTDSRKAEKVYNAVKEEYLNVCKLWNESELSQLQEIQ